MYVYIYIYMYIYSLNKFKTRGVSAGRDDNDNDNPDLLDQVEQFTKPNYLFTKSYGQFSKLHVCFCVLDPGNLKFDTVRTNKQHIRF